MNQKHLKKIPIGITSISQLLKGDYVYVDKTNQIYNMLTSESICDYFMVRPKGFGKTLFLNTVAEIFKGNKEIFEGTAIYSSKYNWLKYPVLHFDFSKMICQDSKTFEASLREELKKMAKTNGVEPVEGVNDFELQLRRLIEDLSKKQGTRVVVLVDEYDNPIVESSNRNNETVEKWREVLLSFLTTVTDLSDEFLQFTFVTGVSQLSVCGTKNGGCKHLVDISLNPKYASLMGFTRSELETYFIDHFGEEGFNASKWEEKETFHSGYKFSEEDISVYCPYSILNYLSANATRN